MNFAPFRKKFTEASYTTFLKVQYLGSEREHYRRKNTSFQRDRGLRREKEWGGGELNFKKK
jgi:hypothetical protein